MVWIEMAAHGDSGNRGRTTRHGGNGKKVSGAASAVVREYARC
jgi:hypothetical protein